MTAELVDPFDLEEVGPPRDRYGRPCLIPKTGGKRVPYQRMSTLSGMVCDDFGLSKWQQRLLGIGLAQREDLTAMIAGLPALNDAKCDKKTLTREQREQDVATKNKLDEYIEQALETAGRNWKANMGTAIHGLVENRNAEGAPSALQPDVQACLDHLAARNMTVLASEVFVANDELMAAGSFDHLIEVPLPGWGVVVADVKTGSVDKKGLAFATQLSGYANAEVYDWHDDSRAPLDSLAGGLRVNRKVGLLIHIPLGAGRCDLYRINLQTGYHAARLATNVRKARSMPDFMTALEL